MKVRGYVVSPILESTAVVLISLQPCERITAETQPHTISFPGRLFVRQFKGACSLEETDAGTRVVRTEEYVTTDNWLGHLVERRGDSWLSQHLADVELPRLKRLVELDQAREQLEGKVEREPSGKNPYGLTFRELTVLHLVAAGKADKQVAKELGISQLTVHKHVANIRAKMDASSRTEAAVRAVREGLLD